MIKDRLCFAKPIMFKPNPSQMEKFITEPHRTLELSIEYLLDAEHLYKLEFYLKNSSIDDIKNTTTMLLGFIEHHIYLSGSAQVSIFKKIHKVIFELLEDNLKKGLLIENKLF